MARLTKKDLVYVTLRNAPRKREKPLTSPFIMFLKPQKLKPKHNFFMLLKNQRLDAPKLEQLLDNLIHLQPQYVREIVLGTDDQTTYILFHAAIEFFAKLRHQLFICYPNEVFLKKVRRTDFPNLNPKLLKQQYALYYSPVYKPELNWYKDLFLFFLICETTIFSIENFCILRSPILTAQYMLLIDPTVMKEILIYHDELKPGQLKLMCLFLNIFMLKLLFFSTCLVINNHKC